MIWTSIMKELMESRISHILLLAVKDLRNSFDATFTFYRKNAIETKRFLINSIILFVSCFTIPFYWLLRETFIKEKLPDQQGILLNFDKNVHGGSSLTNDVSWRAATESLQQRYHSKKWWWFIAQIRHSLWRHLIMLAVYLNCRGFFMVLLHLIL